VIAAQRRSGSCSPPVDSDIASRATNVVLVPLVGAISPDA
jgi:hypothetical protein